MCPKGPKAEVPGSDDIKQATWPAGNVCKSGCVGVCSLCEVTCELESVWSVGVREEYFKKGGVDSNAADGTG